MKVKFYILLLLSSILCAANVEEEVIATGYGMDKKQALDNAFMDAVKQSVGVVIDSQTMLENDEIIQDQILTASNGFVTKYDIVKESANNGLYQVTIKATVKNQTIQEKVKSLNIATHKVSIDGNALKNQIAKEQTKALSEAEVSQMAQKYLNDFLENSQKELLNFMQLKVTNVNIDTAKYKDGNLPYSVDFEIGYNYDLYLKMVNELEEKFSNLGLKVKKRVAIINDYKNIMKIREVIEKDFRKLDSNQLVIIKKFAGKFSVDIWDLPFNLPKNSFDIFSVRLCYEVLNGNKVIDFACKNLPRYSLYTINNNSFRNYYLPYWFNRSSIVNSFSDTISATANLENIDISKLKDLTVKVTLEEK